MKAAQEEIDAWAVRSLSGGAGAAYQYIKKADDLNFIPPSPVNPTADAASQLSSWEQYWVLGRPGYAEAFTDAMHHLRGLAVQSGNALPPITVSMLRGAFSAMSAHRGRAFDAFNPDELRCLPDAALQELAYLLMIMESSAPPPSHFCAT